MFFRCALAALLLPAAAQDTMSDVQITLEAVAGHVYMLSGRGGNIGLSAGPSGAFLVDDQYAPLSERIAAAIATVSAEPPRFVINTHWHGDHTGGNEHFGSAGAILVAHDNVRTRLATEQFIAAFDRSVPPAPAAALPVVTFTDAVTFHWNGDEIRVRHLGPAHTDGDAIVHFVGADVIHTGDLFFNGMYPFIDQSSGGSVSGMIAAADAILALAGENTRLIPGHGPLARGADVQAFRDMLAGVRGVIVEHVAAGRSLDDIVASRPTAAFDETWGNGFFKPEPWTRVVATLLIAEHGTAALQGTWTGAMPDGGTTTLVFEDGGAVQWTLAPAGDAAAHTVAARWALNTASTPWSLDLDGFAGGPLAGQTLFGIVELRADGQLRWIAEAGPSGEPGPRPAAFEASQTVTLRRAGRQP